MYWDRILAGVGEAHHQEREKMQHVAADGHGGKPLSAHELPDDDHIHHVIDRLEQVGTEQGECKDEKKPGDAALSEVPDQRIGRFTGHFFRLLNI